MQVAETAETLNYIKGSNKPNKVRTIYAIHTVLHRAFTAKSFGVS